MKQPSDKWLAVRIETFLGHYWQGGDPLTGEVVLSDWMACLQGFPQPAVEWAFAEWLDTQPRYRARPGDIAGLAREWVSRQTTEGRKQNLSREALTETQERVVQWAVETMRLSRDDAVDAVRQIGSASYPEWLLRNDNEAERCIYCVRQHPMYQDPPEAAKSKRGAWA